MPLKKGTMVNSDPLSNDGDLLEKVGTILKDMKNWVKWHRGCQKRTTGDGEMVAQSCGCWSPCTVHKMHQQSSSAGTSGIDIRREGEATNDTRKVLLRWEGDDLRLAVRERGERESTGEGEKES